MTDIFLYAGEPSPNDIRLRDPTAAGAVATTPVGAAIIAALIFASWVPADQVQQLPRNLPVSITAVRVDNPPPSAGNANAPVYAAWQALDTPAQQRRLGSPALLAAPAASFKPTPNAAVYGPVYAAWQSVDPVPQQPARLLAPALTAVRVDNPPGLQPAWSGYAAWVPDSAPQQRAIQFVPAAPISSGLPVSNAALSPVYAAWQLPELSYAQPRRLLPPSLLAVQVDNPPPQSRDFSGVYAAWQAVDYPAQRASFVPPATIVATFQPAPLAAALAPIYASWQPVDPAAQMPRLLSPAFLDVRVDAPPVSQPANAFWAAYTTWLIEPPLIQPARYIAGAIAPPGVVVAANSEIVIRLRRRR